MADVLPPTEADLREWLGSQAGAITPELAADALAVALEEQAAACVVTPYTASLHYAALRRAARVIAARPHALGTVDAADFGILRLSAWDAEVRTAEAAYLVGGFG